MSNSKKDVKKERPVVVGLDIGTAKIAVIVGMKNENNKLDILGYGHCESHGVKRGIIYNIDRTVEAIREAVRKAEEMAGLEKITHVYVGIAGQHITSLHQRKNILRKNRDIEITKEEINDFVASMYNMVIKPGEKIIHVIPQEFTVDTAQGITDPAGMFGDDLAIDFHIVTGQELAVKNLVRCANKANVEVEDIILEPLASSASVLSEQEKEAGVALVDIGGGTSDIAIFKDGILRHTAVIPLGGEIVTEDIKEGCAILKNQAELLKIRFGSAMSELITENQMLSIETLKGMDPKEISVRNLASIIQARMEDIIDLVYFELKSKGFEKQKLIGGIVLTGGGSLLKNLPQFTSLRTGISARVGWPSAHLSSNIPKEINSPIYSTSIGLVLKGYEKIENESTGSIDDESSTPSIWDLFFKKGRKIMDKRLE